MSRTRLHKVVAALAVAGVVLTGCARDTPGKKQASDETLTTALWELAAGAEADRDYEKAASYYDRLYERLPGDEKALLGYLRNLRYLGLSKEAIKAAQTGVEKHGRTPDLTLELGKAQLAAAQINDARETFQKVIAAHGNRWEAHSAMGIVLDRLGLHSQAQSAYAKALELSPDNVAVRNNLALSLAQSDKLDEAIELLRKVVETENSTPQSRQNLAMLYGLKGDLDKAEVLAQQDLPPDLVASNMATFRILHAVPPPVRAPKGDAAKFRPAAGKPRPGKTAAAAAVPKPEKSAAVATPPPAAPAAVTAPGTPAKAAAKPAPAAKAQPVYISNGAANVRRGPSTEFAPVAFLKKDDKVRVLGKSSNGAWYLVLLEDGRRGYIYHKLIRRN